MIFFMTTLKIKNKNDIKEQIINRMKNGDEIYFNNKLLSLKGGPKITKRDGRYFEYNSGVNWRDKSEDERTEKEVIDLIWANRAWINKNSDYFLDVWLTK